MFQFLNNILITLLIFILLVITLILFGFEKERKQNRKHIIKIVILCTVSFIALQYGIGLIAGFYKSVYSFKIVNIIKNVVPVIILVFLTEMYRYQICKKGSKNKWVLFLNIIFFVLIDISLNLNVYDLANKKDILELCTLVLLASVSKNIMLCDFAKKSGYTTCLIYNLIMSLYIYILPILPDIDKYLQAVLLFLFPLFVKYIINYKYDMVYENNFKDKKILVKIISGLLILCILIMISLSSNLFRYWTAVVGSGSMTPTINIGDIVIIDKDYSKHLDKLQENDILVFKKEDSIYTHRIIKIEKENSEYKITTKGDNVNNEIDNWVVKNEEVIGVVKLKIPYIGYPTIWLSKMF